MEETEFHMTLIVNESFFCAITFSFTQILIWNFVKLFTNMYRHLSHSYYSKLIIFSMHLSKHNLIPNFKALFLALELHNTEMIKYARRWLHDSQNWLNTKYQYIEGCKQKVLSAQENCQRNSCVIADEKRIAFTSLILHLLLLALWYPHIYKSLFLSKVVVQHYIFPL